MVEVKGSVLIVVAALLAGCSSPKPEAMATGPVTARGPAQLYTEGVFRGDWARVEPQLAPAELTAFNWSKADAKRFFDTKLAPRLKRFAVVGYADRNRGEGCLAALKTPTGKVVETELFVKGSPSAFAGTISGLVRSLWYLEYVDKTGTPGEEHKVKAIWEGYDQDQRAFRAAGLPGLYGPSGFEPWSALAAKRPRFEK